MTSLSPKVSIVVPVYNVEKYLDRCMQSLLNQTLKDIEIILVDDGSPDNCPQLCDDYASKDSRIKVIHKQNAGLGMARNTGINNAIGDYIMFLDSDDTYVTDACQRLYDAANNHDADVSTGTFNKELKSGEWTAEHDTPQIVEGEFIKQYAYDMIACSPEIFTERLHPVSACLLCINREFLLSSGIRFESERKVASEDTLFKIKLFKGIGKLVVLDYPFYNYFLNGDSLTHIYRHSDFENLSVLYNEMSAQFDKSNEDIQNRISRFIMADARSHIFKLLESTEPNKYSTLKSILNNRVWSLTQSFPINKQPLTKRIFYKLCRGKMTLLLFLYAKSIKMILK